MTDVTQKHPALSMERLAEYRLMRDSMGGESPIKSAGTAYLVEPSGFRQDPSTQLAKYDAYKRRAQFPEILSPSVSAMIGIIHGKEIEITIPDGMGFLWEDADGDGLPLEAFHRRITRDLLVYGGYGVLADAPEGSGDPYLVGYAREAIINWDRNWFVLDESGKVRNGFDWNDVDRYRVLSMDAGGYIQSVYEGDTSKEVIVKAAGAKRLPRVPFAIGNAIDMSANVIVPPLIGVARAALAIYQLTADYRHQLFWSGQETLVAINGDAPSAVGAGVVHQMNGAEGQSPDLKYVSPSCAGIDAHLEAMRDNRTTAIQAGARLLEQSDQVQESGSARKLRFASETATLTSIAMSSCMILERALRNVAMILGLPEKDIVVKPPAELLDTSITPEQAEALMRVWIGGGMSWETYYENLRKGGIASPERDADAEYALIEGQGGSGDLTAQTAPMGFTTKE